MGTCKTGSDECRFSDTSMEPSVSMAAILQEIEDLRTWLCSLGGEQQPVRCEDTSVGIQRDRHWHEDAAGHPGPGKRGSQERRQGTQERKRGT